MSRISLPGIEPGTRNVLRTGFVREFGPAGVLGEYLHAGDHRPLFSRPIPHETHHLKSHFAGLDRPQNSNALRPGSINQRGIFRLFEKHRPQAFRVEPAAHPQQSRQRDGKHPIDHNHRTRNRVQKRTGRGQCSPEKSPPPRSSPRSRPTACPAGTHSGTSAAIRP